MTGINGAISQHTFRLYQVVAARPGRFAIPSRVAPSARRRSRRARRSARLRVRHGSWDGRGRARRKRARWRSSRHPPEGHALRRSGRPGHLQGLLSSRHRGHVDWPAEPRHPRLHPEPALGGARQAVESSAGCPIASRPGPGSFGGDARSLATELLPSDLVRYREASRRPVADPFAGLLDDDAAVPPSAMLRSFMSRSPFGDDFDLVRAGPRARADPPRDGATGPGAAAAHPRAAGDFRGAVGHFDVRATLTPTAGTAFEPMTLELPISGRGNFYRVTTTGLPSAGQWKSYPPRASFRTARRTRAARCSSRPSCPRRAVASSCPADRVQLLRSRSPALRHARDDAADGAGGAERGGSGRPISARPAGSVRAAAAHRQRPLTR